MRGPNECKPVRHFLSHHAPPARPRRVVPLLICRSEGTSEPLQPAAAALHTFAPPRSPPCSPSCRRPSRSHTIPLTCRLALASLLLLLLLTSHHHLPSYQSRRAPSPPPAAFPPLAAFAPRSAARVRHAASRIRTPTPYHPAAQDTFGITNFAQTCRVPAQQTKIAAQTPSVVPTLTGLGGPPPSITKGKKPRFYPSPSTRPKPTESRSTAAHSSTGPAASSTTQLQLRLRLPAAAAAGGGGGRWELHTILYIYI